MATKPRRAKTSPSHRLIKGSTRHIASRAKRIADANPKEIVTVSIIMRRKTGAPELLDGDYWSKTPPGQRTFLSRKDFANLYGADRKDVATLRKFARARKLKVIESSLARRTVVLSGTVEQMNRIFHVDLGIYALPDGVYRGREGAVSVPKIISHIVEAVFGLDNRRMMRRHLSAPGVGPAGAVPLTPPQVANLYGFDSINSKGHGQAIGLLEFGGGYVARRVNNKVITPDLNAFFGSVGLATPEVIDVSVDGVVNNADPGPGNWSASSEVTLDIDVAGSVAPESQIVVYFAPYTTQGFVDALTTAIHDDVNKPSVISISWGSPEEDASGNPIWNESSAETIGYVLQEAAMMGVSVFAASGDTGTNCDVDDGGAHVLFPASDPWITGCGGTVITNVNNRYFAEHTWNDFNWSGSVYIGYFGGATGGGFSRFFPEPKWQGPSKTQALRLRLKGRGVPDIAGNASPYSGYTIQVFGQWNVIGGTSATAPLYAAFFARLNAMLGHNLGYLNPTLYEFSATPGVFRDIKDGVSNAAPIGLPGGQVSLGYKSSAGWDPCTGLGVIEGGAFVERLIHKPK
jgi:kumamolisin